MKFYMAPLEGITTYIYRNIHHDRFSGLDKYYTPFVSPTSNHDFKSREKRDVLPENNRGIPLVPQILSNHADEFLYTAERLVEYGYSEINLNLGCPSGTVVAKGRGSGFLSDLEGLNRFLGEIFDKLTVPVSVKTRIGRNEPSEFRDILAVYNKYPICELTIHPRVRADFYRGRPNWDVFEEALENSVNPVCYNGDINSVEDYERFCERFPAVERIMIGRGLIANPALVQEIKTKRGISWQERILYANELQHAYEKIMPEIPVLYKMKEIWSYMAAAHPDSAKFWKKIKKTKHLAEYERLLAECRDIDTVK